MASQGLKLNESQKRAKRAIDLATDTVVNYKAKEVPPMANLTPEGLVEELGWLNEARKELEKSEKILKERLKSLISFPYELKSDNFTLKYSNKPRTALNQTRAKGKLEELGLLADYMDTTDVPTMNIEAN